MTSVHRTAAWAAARRRALPLITASLPAPCVNCGRPVFPNQDWQVGHIVSAALGGELSLSNLGPAHRHCNQLDGARLGAKIANQRRRARRTMPQW